MTHHLFIHVIYLFHPYNYSPIQKRQNSCVCIKITFDIFLLLTQKGHAFYVIYLLYKTKQSLIVNYILKIKLTCLKISY